MEAKEKLVKLLYEWEGHRFKDEIANAIIEAFPQIEKKPVKIEVYQITGESQLVCDYEIASELDRYKNEYFVELVD